MVDVKTASKAVGTWSKFKKVFTIGSVTLFLVILLVHALIVAIQTRDIGPALEDIGYRFIGPTKDLNEKSLAIIESKGVYDASKGSIRGFLATIAIYAGLFAPLFLIGLYIHIFAKLSEKTFGGTGHPFKNYAFGFLVFAITQSVALLVFDPSPEKLELAISPFASAWHFVQAVPYLIDPVATGIQRIENTEIINQTLNITRTVIS